MINKKCKIAFKKKYCQAWPSQVALVVRNPPANAGDMGDVGLIPGSGRSPGGGHSSPLQCSCWRVPWTEETGRLQSTGAHSCTRLKWFSTHLRTHALSSFRVKGNSMENWKRNGQILLGHLAVMNPCPFFFGIEFTQTHVKCPCNTGNSFILSFNRGAIFKEDC